jgi:hypothetical protein
MNILVEGKRKALFITLYFHRDAETIVSTGSQAKQAQEEKWKRKREKRTGTVCSVAHIRIIHSIPMNSEK